MGGETSAAADLSAAVDELLKMLPSLAELLPLQDDDGATSHGVNRLSAPPWNSAVANVMLDIHAGARALEAEFRAELTGRDRGWRRGGSDANTEAALRALATLGSQLGLAPAQAAATLLERWRSSAAQLPAVDTEPSWRKLTPGPDGLPPKCPYCGTYLLRVAVRSRVVRCFNPARCLDGTGSRPTASLELGAVSGEPMLVWADGSVQFPP
jgi:hypothetical protein